MCHNSFVYCRNVYRQKSWWSKLLALIVVVFYFVALALTYHQPYLWLTLTFAVILCLATLACSREDPIIAFRRGGPTPRASIADDSRDPPPVEIWVTDIPPSYSFVMGNATPPPSYGSAVLKFPVVGADISQKSEGVGNPTSTPMLKRVLDPNRYRSISRQVSEISRLSRQVSESGIGRLSHQSSINALDNFEDGNDDWESGIVIIVPPRTRRTISQSSDSNRTPQIYIEGSGNDETPESTQTIQIESNPNLEQRESIRDEILPQVFTCTENGNPRTVIVVQVTDWDQIREEPTPSDGDNQNDAGNNDNKTEENPS